MKQVADTQHAHVEQPTYVLSWQTPALRSLSDHRASCHQRQYGALCQEDFEWSPEERHHTTKHVVPR